MIEYRTPRKNNMHGNSKALLLFDRNIQSDLVGFLLFFVLLDWLKLVGLCFCWGGWRHTVLSSLF